MLITYSIPIFFLLIGVELVAARIQHQKLYRLNDAFANIGCGITDQILSIFVKVVTLGLYIFVASQESLQLIHVETAEIPWWGIILAFLGVDMCYYWAHRMSHEINLFWAGHVVHHQSEEYNLSVALRQGAFQGFFTFMFYLPLAFIGLPADLFFVLSQINTLYQFWIHTETIGKLGPIEWIFNTPSHHRVHHARNPKYIDKNHAGSLIIWDRLFGTFQKEEEHPTYGITTPLNTWNPLYAQVSHFGSIWQDFKKVKGVGNKLKVLFYKPGWLPEELGGYRKPPEVDANSYQKYDINLPLGMNYYLLTQFILALLASAIFLFTYKSIGEQFGTVVQVLVAVVLSISVMSLGLLFDGKKWAFALEYFRLIGSVIFICILFWSADPLSNIIMASILGFIALASIFWVSRYRIPLQNVQIS